jgi:pyrimidine deaminase RibD-like protein
MKDNDKLVNTKEYDPQFLDQQLQNTLDFLKDNWLDPKSGFVASTLIDNGKSVTATNTFITGNKIRHAEFNAVSLYEEKYDVISPKALLVVTLSPCVVYSGYREGPACSQLLLDKGITKVYVGLIHEKQGGLEGYRKMGFDISETSSEKIKKVSQSLLDLYVANKNLIADNLDEWLKLKQKVGLEIFK